MLGGLGETLGGPWACPGGVLGGLGGARGRSWGGLGAALGGLGVPRGSRGTPIAPQEIVKNTFVFIAVS